MNRLIRGDNLTAHLRGSRLKLEQALYRLSPPKLTPEGIEPETFGGAYSKIPSQPLGQPQMGLLSYVFKHNSVNVFVSVSCQLPVSESCFVENEMVVERCIHGSYSMI